MLSDFEIISHHFQMREDIKIYPISNVTESNQIKPKQSPDRPNSLPGDILFRAEIVNLM